MFVSLDTSQAQVFSLSKIIKQVKIKHNKMFMNKLTNMRARFDSILLYLFMYTHLKIYLFRLEIRLYKFVNRFI